MSTRSPLPTLAEWSSMGDAIRVLRKRAGLTQARLASDLSHVQGVLQSTISELERGEWHPSAGQLELVLSAVSASDDEKSRVRELASALVVRDQTVTSSEGRRAS
jgi:transcriptional regulator with XRE-family HTH domain